MSVSRRRRAVSAVFFVVVVALAGTLVLLLGSTAQGLTRPRGAAASKRKPLTPLADLVASSPWIGAEFGWSVAASGSIAVVGAPYEDSSTGVLGAGAAYVFTKVDGAWTKQVELPPPTPATTTSSAPRWPSRAAP